MIVAGVLYLEEVESCPLMQSFRLPPLLPNSGLLVVLKAYRFNFNPIPVGKWMIGNQLVDIALAGNRTTGR